MVATILIADDDAVQRRLVENMVQRCGYAAVTVDSGDAVMAHLRDTIRHVAQFADPWLTASGSAPDRRGR